MAEKILNKDSKNQDKKAHVRDALRKYCEKKGENELLRFDWNLTPPACLFFRKRKEKIQDREKLMVIQEYLLEHMKKDIKTVKEFDEFVENSPIGEKAKNELKNWNGRYILINFEKNGKIPENPLKEALGEEAFGKMQEAREKEKWKQAEHPEEIKYHALD